MVFTYFFAGVFMVKGLGNPPRSIALHFECCFARIKDIPPFSRVCCTFVTQRIYMPLT